MDFIECFDFKILEKNECKLIFGVYCENILRFVCSILYIYFFRDVYE